MECPVCGGSSDPAEGVCAACGSELTSLPPGEVVAERYEIRAYLGRGGMGSVYRAFDRVLDEEVALKIQRARTADPEVERRFRSEVKLARHVSHPNVCRLHDGGQEGALRWISMELVRGETLASRLQSGPIPLGELLALAVQAADGLAAVHRAGIVHRDLKTLNLMVDGTGGLRLMDFGIARPAAGADTGKASEYALGSPEYMSPEQARGQQADARSDVYALGVVLFELATGRVPFRADTPVATLLRHLQDAPPLEAAPEALRPVLARALAKNPARRYRDGSEIASALRTLPSAGAASRRSRVRPPAAAVAVGIVAVALGALLAWTRTALMDPADGAPTRPPTASPPPPPVGASVAVPPQADRAPDAGAQSTTPRHGLTGSSTPRGAATPEVTPPPSATPAATGAPAQATDPTAPPAAGQPLPAPTPTPFPAPVSVQAPEPAAVAVAEGWLLVVVRPWADVSVDGIPRGQTPLARMPLAAGPHAVLLMHPDFQPWPRRVTIRAGETSRLTVDLRSEGVPRR